jgi:HSP20 family molecular chaperone IbpA
MALTFKPSVESWNFDKLFSPATVVAKEQEHEYVWLVESPMQEFTVKVDNDKLTVSGEYTASHTAEEVGWMKTEKEYSSFTRTTRLPANVDSEKITAKKVDGNKLQITLPKVFVKGAQKMHKVVPIA